MRKYICIATPEGFTSESLEILRNELAFGFTRNQAIRTLRRAYPRADVQEVKDEVEALVVMGWLQPMGRE